MEVIINDLMKIFEVSNIQYLYIVIACIFGGLILWKMK